MATGPRFGIIARYEAQFPNASLPWFAGWYQGMLGEAVAALDAAENERDEARAGLRSAQSDTVHAAYLWLLANVGKDVAEKYESAQP